jgi:hypothetical protein
MDNLSIYYIEYEYALAPRFLCVWFGRDSINWDESYIYIPIDCPFQRKLSEEFDSDVLSLSIAQTELITNKNKPRYFGIHLPTVQKRLNKTRADTISYDQNDIEQFIIQIGDLEEILEMDVNSHYAWR